MTITLKQAGQEDRLIQAENGVTLFKALTDADLRLDAPCGGKGKCGKCVVTATGELSVPNSQEIKFAEGNASRRLACQALVLGDVELRLEGEGAFKSMKSLGEHEPYDFDPPLKEIDLEILDRQDPTGCLDIRDITTDSIRALNEIALVDSTYSRGRAVVWEGELLESWPIDKDNDRRTGPLAAAFDLGTTGLALAVIDLSENRIIAIDTALNPQVVMGGDVISRITETYDSHDNLLRLQSLGLEGLAGMVTSAVGNVLGRDISAAVVSGNSTMQHLLAAVNPKNLAQAPYRPVFTHMLDISHLAPRLNISPNAKVLMAPMISSYVGGDIVAGILAVQLQKRKGTVVFIDIGTNGEIVISRDGKLVATSCAAGPALEGMNILCGTRAVTGAIDSFVMEEGYNYKYTTIGDAPAMGICGSALIDICAFLVKHKVINKGGRMKNPADKELLGEGGRFWLTDKVFLDQLDVRQVQLAKGAIAAAMEMLMERLGLTLANIDEIVIAGSFGYHLRADSLRYISLIPPDYEGPVTFVGNSSLAGSARLLCNRDSIRQVNDIIKEVEVIELGFDPKFQEEFVKHLAFPDVSKVKPQDSV
ncbi:MAG: ASKHA domain-containing protein [Deltaproteobacteria bacterium]|nr:ASKHA domain-containing protein [Deltaproteobacteria bacterium]